MRSSVGRPSRSTSTARPRQVMPPSASSRGRSAWRRARVERAGVEAEEVADLTPDQLDDLGRRRAARGGEARRRDHAGQVAGADARPRLLAPAPERDLGDREADQREQHGGLDVVALGDGEVQVGLGEEEVERGGAHDGRDQPGDAVAGRRDRDHHEDEHERGVVVGDQPADQGQQGAHGDRRQHGRDEGEGSGARHASIVRATARPAAGTFPRVPNGFLTPSMTR